MEAYLKISYVNLKHNLIPHILVTVLFLCISPLIMGIENLDAKRVAQVLELYVALVGIILLVPIFLPDQDKNIRELLETKAISMVQIHMVRMIQASALLLLFIGAYIGLLKFGQCTFPTGLFFWGTAAEAVFLGGLGVAIYSFFDHIAVAYMVPAVYYITGYSGGSKYMMMFYPFSMMEGSYTEKVYMGVAGVVLIVVGILYRHVKKFVFT